MAVVAVQIDACGIFTRVQVEAAGIEARNEPKVCLGPLSFFEKALDCEGTGGFVAVDARGEVEVLAGVGMRAAIGAEVQPGRIEKGVALPSRAGARGGGLLDGRGRYRWFRRDTGRDSCRAFGLHHRRLACGRFLCGAGATAITAAVFILVAEAVLVPTRVEAEILQHLEVLFDRLIQRREVIADHERAGASHEDHALEIAEIYGASAGDHDFLFRENEAEAGDCFEDFEGREARFVGVGRAGDRIEDIDGDDICAEVAEREGEIASVFMGFTHADDSAGADFDAGGFEMLDGFDAVLVGVGGADVREKALRTFEIVVVALEAGGAEALGNFGILDDAEGGVGTGFAAVLEFFEAIADLVENRTFFEAFPGGNEAKGCHPILFCFVGSGQDWRKIDEAVAGRVGLVGSGLSAKFAVLGTAARFDVHDGAKVDFVALEMFTDAIGPGEQGVDVGAGFEVEEPLAFVAGQLLAGEDFFGKVADSGRRLDLVGVNHIGAHG